MTWEEVCADRSLQDLPYKIELNKWGNIEMSQRRVHRAEFSGQIAHLLQTFKVDGLALSACAIETAENVKVPDVAWVSLEHRRRTPHEYVYAIAPEICVEILSPSNLLEELIYKGQLYLQAGAEEFWLCDEKGAIRFFDASGELTQSRLCPLFPLRVEIPD